MWQLLIFDNSLAY